ncbi:MAG: UPF0175 family protein [Acidithiobacillus sp.]
MLFALPVGETLLTHGAKLALAVKLFDQDLGGLEGAARIADISQSEMIDHLGALHIPVVRYCIEEFKAEMDNFERLLVADSGPLIALARLELLRESRSCFHALWVPEMVYVEVTCRGADVFEVIANIPATLDTVSSYGLNPRETLAIALALQEGAAVLIDERKGRMASQRWGSM